MKTAAVLIIGDEILSGKYADENTPYLVRRLRALGVSLRRIQVLPDEPTIIAQAVQQAVAEVDWVFTTGGVGPTHDDRTMEAIALAFGVPLIAEPSLVAVVDRAFPDGATPAALRMASVPQGAELWWDGAVRFPLVVKDGVHILPGVPSILQRKFEASAHRWRGVPLHTATLRTLEREVDIAARLQGAEHHHPGVAIGSYPRLDDDPRHVVVTLEGEDAAQIEACATWLAGRLAPGPA